MSPHQEPATAESAAILLLAGPSCSGKTRLVGDLLRARPEIRRPVTTTTRRPRPGERNGIDYYFLTRAAFRDQIQRGAFVEHARYGNDLYGLTWREIERIRELGSWPIAVLDVQGVDSVRRLMPTVSVFVRAPVEEIEARVRRDRPASDPESRLRRLPKELAAAATYDIVIDNHEGRYDDALRALLRFYDQNAAPRLALHGTRCAVSSPAVRAR